jgi:NAD(P)H-dependent nitrite reductase small subunit
MIDFEGFYLICSENDLKDSQGKRFYINDTDIAIFKVGDKIYAVSNVCPHQQASKIYEGFVENNCVVCPLHGWTFNLKTGNLHSGSKGLDTYPTKIVDGKIYAKVVKKELNW